MIWVVVVVIKQQEEHDKEEEKQARMHRTRIMPVNQE
jgi:hypothetical protein